MKPIHKTSTMKDFPGELHPPITKCGIRESLDKDGMFHRWQWQWRHVTCKRCLAKRTHAKDDCAEKVKP